jgi:signal transduction histidine kinase
LRAIEVVIKDNGKGFNVAGATRRTQHGFGLTGLQERARILGGTLAVHSTPGKGTILTLTIRSQDGNHVV